MSGLAKSPVDFETTLVGLRPDLYRFASLQLRDDQLADDGVQEAMMAALSSELSFSGRSSLKTWVFAILRNKIVDAIRQRGRAINVSALTAEDQSLDQAFEALFKPNDRWSADSKPNDWGDPEDTLHQQQFWTVFEACLKHLPENTARVFMMREFLEFDTAEVCAELSLTTSNCHVILHRARNGLRQCLEQNWFTTGEH
ncbi:MAG: sigma-70 family RNA polymerase sigma factor [Sterolibacterium sp.]|jgi:RNA polymerase sigma-70 factor (ECF subfamily)